MAKTTVLIDVNIGAQVPPSTAWMVWAAPFPFDSGNTYVLPAGGSVKLVNGKGQVEVDGGVWIVTAVAPGFIKTQAWRVPESDVPVQFNALVEETNKDLIGFGPTWSARAELAALSVIAKAEEASGYADAAKSYRDQAQQILDAALSTTDEQMSSRVDDETSQTRASLLLWASQVFLTEEDADTAYATLVQLAKNPDLIVAGAVTGSPVVTAEVVWPGGQPGILTIDSRFSDGAVESYHITYGSPVTKTFTQPAITRTSSGLNVPQIVVS